MTEPLSFVTICGSLREGSLNSSLLGALDEIAPAGVTFTRLDWRDLPLFDEDLEKRGTPALVGELHRAIRGSDGLVISTPEYNHGIPGGLKNLIDWLSRGPAPHGLFGVPVGIMGVSNGSFGTTRGQYQLRQVLTALNAPTMPAPQMLVTFGNEKFADGKLIHDGTRKVLGQWLDGWQKWARKFPPDQR
jgi:chromate reductase